VDPNEKMLDLLGQIVKWSREAALPNLQKRVGTMLDTEIKVRVYHAIRDGMTTIRKLEDAGLGVSRDSAQKLVEEWEAAGLVDAGSIPPRATFTLAELGIATPNPKETHGKKSATK
jgi:hypothetical protein